MNTINKHPRLFWTPSQGYAARPSEFSVDFICLHYTAGRYPGDLNWLTRSPRPSCPSAHFYLRKNGDLHFQVRLENMAFHAGIRWSRPYTWQWRRWRALRPNERSIGIEIENLGNEEYTEEQYKALGFLIPALLLRFDLPLKTIPNPWRGCDPRTSKNHGGDACEIELLKNFRGLLAHGNIHFSKVDPGLKFEWGRVLSITPIPSPTALTSPQNIICRGDPADLGEGLVYA